MSTERYVVFSHDPDTQLTHHDLVDVPQEAPDRAAAEAMNRAMAHRLGKGQSALPVVAWRVDQLRQACEEWSRSQQALQVEGPEPPEPAPPGGEGRKFFRTTFEFEVLAEGEPFLLRTLGDLAYQCGEGPCSGLKRNLRVEEVPAAEFERLCLEHGTDIAFFLNEDTLARTGTEKPERPLAAPFFDEEFFRPEVIASEIMRVCNEHDPRLAGLWAAGRPLTRETLSPAVLTALEGVCQKHGTTLDEWFEAACPSRHDPEGEHEAGYRCTLPEGHLGDHQANGTTPGEPVHAWGAMEGVAAPPGQGRQR